MKPVKTSSPAPVAEGGPVRPLLTATSVTAAASSGIPRAMMVEESVSLSGTFEGVSEQGAAQMLAPAGSVNTS